MKYATAIAGALLGLMFIAASVMVLFKLAPEPTLKEGTDSFYFMKAFMPTGYMTFVKVCELAGGILVAIPKFRNFGLLILGPIILNILAYTIFIAKNEGLAGQVPMCLLALFLLWDGRKAFAGLLR